MFENKEKNQKQSANPFVLKTKSFRYGKLEKYSHQKSWIEDSFIHEGGEADVVGCTFNFSKLKFFSFCLIFFIGILMARTAYLQIVRGDYYLEMAEKNRLRIKRIEAKRGIIYDRNKKPLVRNIANFMLYFIPIDLPKEEKERSLLFEEIAFILYPDNETERDLLVWSMFESIRDVRIGSLSSYSPLFIVDSIEYEKAMQFYLKADSMQGVILTNKDRRQYLNNEILSLSHILGYTGKINQKELDENEGYLLIDYIGKTGIEYFWEDELKGINGNKKIEVDALGYLKKIISKEDVEDGHNLVLSIDYDLQKEIEIILKKYLKERGLFKASVIAIEPETGEILAIISLPSFDNNIFARGATIAEYKALIDNKNNPLFNRSISGEYPSGSTIKPVISVAALEEGVISENTSFLSNGGVRIGQWFFPDWKAGGHGITNVRKAISDSVNTFYYYIGGGNDDFVGLGVDRIAKYLELFGIGEKTGIDLIGEASGFIPTKEWKKEAKNERWYIGDTYHLAIGQGDLLVTPLQVACFTSVFANGTKLIMPHLVKSILSGEDELVKKRDEEMIRGDFIDPYNIEVVRQGMRQGVISGSSRRLSALPVTSAGKTGTAQWSSKKDPHAWWTGFAPYKNPEITLTVLIEEGKEGSDIAVGVAYEILKYYFKDR